MKMKGQKQKNAQVAQQIPKLIKKGFEYLETEAPAIEYVFLYQYIEKLDRIDRLKREIEKGT